MANRLLFIGFLLLAPAIAASQVGMSRSVPEDYSESLHIDPLAFAGTRSGESRLDVFVLLGYDNLSFVKKGDRYGAAYEMTITVNDSAGALVNEKSWTEKIEGITFDESVSAASFALQQRSFTLRPGRYAVTVLLRDLDSKKTKKSTRQAIVHDFASPIIAMSDIMLVGRLSVTGNKKSILPNVSPNVGNIPDAFYTFCEVYNRAGNDSVRFVASIYDRKGDLKLEADTVQFLREGRNDLFMRLAHTALPLGDYVVTIRAFPTEAPRGDRSGAVAGTSRSFIIRWKGLPQSMKDIDVAIEQLQYIVKDDEMSELKSATTVEEKQKKFIEFWKKRDPNPNTPRNEKMEDYYARVEYANRHFSTYREGWRTDMGLVFIILGPPSNVERHPFEVDSKPYEVWAYYDINYQFVFLDQNGFGDYRLISPLWEVYNRRRD